MFKKKIPSDWNLNVEFIKWLNKWFKEYKKNASKYVDLEFHKYKYKNKEYTQLEIIDRIIELTDKVKDEYCYNEDDVDRIDEIFDLFHLVFWNMWW